MPIANFRIGVSFSTAIKPYDFYIFYKEYNFPEDLHKALDEFINEYEKELKKMEES
jgi:hypothetical protein